MKPGLLLGAVLSALTFLGAVRLFGSKPRPGAPEIRAETASRTSKSDVRVRASDARDLVALLAPKIVTAPSFDDRIDHASGVGAIATADRDEIVLRDVLPRLRGRDRQLAVYALDNPQTKAAVDALRRLADSGDDACLSAVALMVGRIDRSDMKALIADAHRRWKIRERSLPPPPGLDPAR